MIFFYNGLTKNFKRSTIKKYEYEKFLEEYEFKKTNPKFSKFISKIYKQDKNVINCIGSKTNPKLLEKINSYVDKLDSLKEGGYKNNVEKIMTEEEIEEFDDHISNLIGICMEISFKINVLKEMIDDGKSKKRIEKMFKQL